MPESTIAIALVWLLVFVYSILGSIDFGAGFWGMVFSREVRSSHAGSLANRFLSPTWEVTNSFLVLLVVALVGFFPKAVTVLGTALILPVSLVLFLLLIRSTFMVYAYSAKRYGGELRVVSGITGLLIPGLLLAVLPISLGGFINVRNGVPVLHFGRLLASPTLWAHLGFGLCTELFLSALFLSDYCKESGDDKAYFLYRRMAIWLGPLTLFFAVVTTYTFVPEAAWMRVSIENHILWFIASMISFVIGYAALLLARPSGPSLAPRIAFTTVIGQYAFASIGYGLSHLPFIIKPQLTVEQGFTNEAIFYALLAAYVIGILILGPAFYLFWKLFLKDKQYLRQE